MSGAVHDGGNTACGSAFNREHKLTKEHEFKRVFRKPYVSHDTYFKVLARPNSAGNARLGLAVSRRVDRRAAVRNRIKRVIRESFRTHYCAGRPLIDVVVLPRQGIATISNRRLFQSLKGHWARLDRHFEG